MPKIHGTNLLDNTCPLWEWSLPDISDKINHVYRITINKGKEKQLERHHPWVFTGAIGKVEGDEKSASWALVSRYDGTFLAKGWYDEKSHIVLHLLSWDYKENLDENWIERKVRESIERRREFFLPSSPANAFRIIHGEADFLPGIVADVYARTVRVVISSRFGNTFAEVIAKAIDDALHPDYIALYADPNYAKSEGIKEKERIFVDGKEVFDFVEKNVTIKENGIWYEIEGGKGQKSGFYLDQRDNRCVVEEFSYKAKALDVCSFTGSFTMHMLKGGASSVKAIDSSESALRHLIYQVHLNENKGTLSPGSREKVEILPGDAFDLLRKENDNSYDMVVLDPPKLAKTKGQLQNAIKAYKDINLNAMRKVRKGGILVTFSCSGSLSREDFKMILSWCAKDLGYEVQILKTLSQGEDHPVRLSFPESEYLKGFVLRILK